MEILKLPSQSCFSVTEDKNEGRKTNKAAAVKALAGTNKSWEETQHLLISLGTKLYTVIDCKWLSSKYYIYIFIYLFIIFLVRPITYDLLKKGGWCKNSFNSSKDGNISIKPLELKLK